MPHKKVHLRVDRFKLGTNVLLRRILSQIAPIVKSVASDLFGIGGIELDFAVEVIAKVTDEDLLREPPSGYITVTVLLPFETSIPIAFNMIVPPKVALMFTLKTTKIIVFNNYI